MTNKLEIPLRYINADVSDVPELKGYAINDSLFLTGNVGSGKTHAMWAIANKRVKGCREAEVWSYETLLRDIRSTFHGRGRFEKTATGDFQVDEHYIIRSLSRCPWLGIDDLGSSRPDAEAGAFALSVIYEVINNRYTEKKPIVLTSNKSLDGLGREFDARIMSRIAGMCKVVNFQGKDRRIKNA